MWMRESFQTRITRWLFNLYPVYRRTGGRVTFIADDFSQVNIKIPLNWKTKNYVGTIFGGSMYGAVDPVYMIMFIKLLGTKYTVWDKSGHIHHKRPGRSTLRAKFSIDQVEIESIKHALEGQDKINRTYTVELLDKDNAICARIEKTLYFSKKKISNDDR
jgi:hypothetical protein